YHRTALKVSASEERRSLVRCSPANASLCYTDKILCVTITGTLPAKALASIREAPHVSTTRRSGKAHPLLQIDSDKTVIECNVAVCQRMGYLRASRSRHANLGATGRSVRRTTDFRAAFPK